MSDDYYLNCQEHNEAVHLTDNKLNPPIDKGALKTFLMYHFGHDIILVTENVVDFDNVKRFKKWYEKHCKEQA